MLIKKHVFYFWLKEVAKITVINNGTMVGQFCLDMCAVEKDVKVCKNCSK